MSDLKFKTFIEAIQEKYIFYVHNNEGIFTYVSPSATAILGYSPDEFWVDYRKHLTHSTINQEAEGYTQKAILGLQQPLYRVEMYHKDGSIRLFEVTETPVFNTERVAYDVYGVAQDITQEIQQQEFFEKQNLLFQEMENLAAIGSCEFDLTDQIVIVSDQVYKMLGILPKKSIPREELLTYIHPDDLSKVLCTFDDVMESEYPIESTFRLIVHDKTIKTVSKRIVAKRDHYGIVTKIIGIMWDISEKILLDSHVVKAQRVAKLGSWQENLLNNNVIITDEIFHILEIPKQKVVSINDLILSKVHPDDKEKVLQCHKKLHDRDAKYQFEYRVIMEDGRVKWICQYCEYKYDRSGQAMQLFCLMQDKSEQQQLVIENSKTRQMLYQQSKLSELGESIAFIFHQWKEPLSQINALVADIELVCATGNLSKKRLDEILEEFEYTTHQMSVSIESMRNYINPQKIRERFNVKQSIDEVLMFYTSLLDRQKIEYEISNTVHFYISGYKNELMQIVLILLNNAKDALRESSQKFPKITLQTFLLDEVFQIEITDNGEGILESNINAIFNPYFTTKTFKEGMGIGLYTAKLLVEEEIGGMLYLKSRSNPTSFVISFPKGISE
jgi:PAS domain S-box-containing protein